MRILVTGLRGTLAPVIARVFDARGAACVGWDRSLVPIDDPDAVRRELAERKLDAICHLALGSEAWAVALAESAAGRGIPFVFTSTAMVFEASVAGGHRRDDPRKGVDEYGRYKIRCEDAIAAANPRATIVRIGWQIDPVPTGNNMLAQLDRQQIEHGRIEASSAWVPACSFMEDTAQALWELVATPQPGVIHLDSNAEEGHTFDAIVRALAQRFERSDWSIVTHEEYRHDQRLRGETRLPPLSSRLPSLGSRRIARVEGPNASFE